MNEKLYTSPKDMERVAEVLGAPGERGRYLLAAVFGNVHGVYKPGSVKLRPEILKEGQEYVGEKLGVDKPVRPGLPRRLRLELDEIHETLGYGVVKMNVDTDTQYAYTRPVVDHMLKNYDGVLKIDGEVGNKKVYDPRAWGRAAEAGMAERVVAGLPGPQQRGHQGLDRRTEQVSRTRGLSPQQSVTDARIVCRNRSHILGGYSACRRPFALSRPSRAVAALTAAPLRRTAGPSAAEHAAAARSRGVHARRTARSAPPSGITGPTSTPRQTGCCRPSGRRHLRSPRRCPRRTIVVKVPAARSPATWSSASRQAQPPRPRSRRPEVHRRPDAGPAKHTRLALAVSKSAVTYPGKVSVTATLTAAGHAVSGFAVRLEHQSQGSSAWHRVTGARHRRTPATAARRAGRSRRRREAPSVPSSAAPRRTGRPRRCSRVGRGPADADAVRPVPPRGAAGGQGHGPAGPSISGVVKLERRIDHHVAGRLDDARPPRQVQRRHPDVQPGHRELPRRPRRRHPAPGRRQPCVTTHVVAPTLRLGSSGAVVGALQRRLHKLHYDVGSRDGQLRLGHRARGDRVREGQGLSKDGVGRTRGVGRSSTNPKQIHLKHPIKSGARGRGEPQASRSCSSARNGKVWRILDTSTAGGYCYTGLQRARPSRPSRRRATSRSQYKVDRLAQVRARGRCTARRTSTTTGYAIHGEGNGNAGGNVPPYPNSHGCVRITNNAVLRYYNAARGRHVGLDLRDDPTSTTCSASRRRRCCPTSPRRARRSPRGEDPAGGRRAVPVVPGGVGGARRPGVRGRRR